MPLHQPKRYSFGAPATGEIQNLPLRLYGTVAESIVDGPGLRYVVFVQGCPHGCPGCHNPGSHDPAGGTPSTVCELWRQIEAMPHLDGVTFSGGEPFSQAAPLAELGRLAKSKGLSVMTYSGWTYEKLIEMAESDADVRALLTVTDILVDGPFVLAQRDLTLRFRGSRNQRLLDVTCYPNSAEAAELSF